MRNTFTFNGISSATFGMYISGNGCIGIPQRPYEFTSVPGRMGDLITGGNSLSNEIITYPAFIAPVNGSYGNYATYEAAFSAIRNAFLSVNGYATLTDTYDTAHYRKACFAGPIEPDTSANLESGTFDIPFNCKPQRFLTNGATKYTISAGSSQTFNCTGKRSAPIIKVTGGPGYFYLTYGSGASGGRTTIGVATTGTIIDFERKECYDENGNSQNLSVSTGFEEINKPFDEMETSVKITAVSVDLEVTFNWYEL